MANRSSVWDVMYGAGEDEEVDDQRCRGDQHVSRQRSRVQVFDSGLIILQANNRHFLSAQPPFATDDDLPVSPFQSNFVR